MVRVRSLVNPGSSGQRYPLMEELNKIFATMALAFGPVAVQAAE
jgi:hypothetical protein